METDGLMSEDDEIDAHSGDASSSGIGNIWFGSPLATSLYFSLTCVLPPLANEL